MRWRLLNDGEKRRRTWVSGSLFFFFGFLLRSICQRAPIRMARNELAVENVG